MAREVLYGLTFTATDKMSPVFAKIGQGAKKLEGSFGSVATSGASVAALAGPVGAALTGIAVAATAGAVAVVKFGQSLIEWAGAAAKVEAIEIRTLSAIRERADFTDEEFEALKRLNGERERTLGIDADAQLQLQGTLASMGVHKDQLDAATKATIGLSTATGQGLNEAAKVVAKSLAGNTGALQEYGIKVASVQEAQAKFAQMFDVAAAQADTYGSRVQALGHSWDGLFEAIGKIIIQNPEVNRAINAIIAGIVSMTERFGPGTQLAEAFGRTVSRVFALVGSTATVTAKVVSAAVRYIDFFYGAKDLRQFATELEASVQDLNMVLAGGQTAADAAATATAKAAESYIEALQAAEYYRRELEGLRAEQAAGRLTADEATEAFKVNAFELGAAQKKMRDLEDWARKTHGTLAVLGEAAAKTAREVRRVGEAAGVKPAAPGTSTATTTTAKPKDAAPGGESWDQFTARMRKANALAREAAMIRGQYLAEQERENQQRVLEIQAAYEDQQAQQRQRALEATAEAARQYAEEIKAFLTNIGMQAVTIFGDAFASVGRLQNETVTEIVRNEEGMLEERTRITGQYIQTVGGALQAFLGDAAEMFGKAALHFIAVKAVEAIASAIARSVEMFGPFGVLIGLAAGAAAYGVVKATSNKMPQPPKFHTGGIVPGVPGRERMALVQSGERVSSVADTVDGRGGGGGITINNNLLVAPSRVQIERVNRDVLLPSARRLQRLGFAG